ncbi:hypothetical protein KR074_002850 [Drosophila pseudoananassae]|nr:hypothetical protein KR074_002850 [Drosophila pseudoananassae]
MCLVSQPESDNSGKKYDNDDEFVLPLHGITSTVLLKILLWAEFHKNDEEPDWVEKVSPDPEEVELQTHDWDKEFLRDEIGSVYDLLEGADYLDIRWLFKLCAQKIALHSKRPMGYLKFRDYLEKMPSLVEFQELAENCQNLDDHMIENNFSTNSKLNRKFYSNFYSFAARQAAK